MSSGISPHFFVEVGSAKVATFAMRIRPSIITNAYLERTASEVSIRIYDRSQMQTRSYINSIYVVCYNISDQSIFGNNQFFAFYA